MEQFLTDNNNEVDAVLSENDGMAGGVVAALEAQGLAGQIPVSGQDGDLAALNRVALGTQTVSVWKDARELGTAAGEAAVALCANPDVAAVAGTAPFTTPEGNEVTSILLEPIPITQDNLDVVARCRAGSTRRRSARAWTPAPSPPAAEAAERCLGRAPPVATGGACPCRDHAGTAGWVGREGIVWIPRREG